MTMFRPGSDGEPLPAGTLIFRLGKGVHLNPVALEKKEALEIFFKPSSDDEKSPGRRLSTWVEEMTLPDQAWEFTGRDPAKAVVACLNVNDIRAVAPPAPFNPLDVEWEQALLPDGSINIQSGADGHCGISGLFQGGDGRRDKDRRKELRSRLADIAEISPVPVPHGFTDDELRLVAFDHYERDGTPSDNPDVHWIQAVRKMRRTKLQENRPRHGQAV